MLLWHHIFCQDWEPSSLGAASLVHCANSLPVALSPPISVTTVALQQSPGVPLPSNPFSVLRNLSAQKYLLLSLCLWELKLLGRKKRKSEVGIFLQVVSTFSFYNPLLK